MTKELEPEVAARLRAVMADLECLNNKAFADRFGTTESAVNNWRLGYNLPHVPEMIRLCEQTGITLDWLYRGFVGTIDPELALRLNRRMQNALK